MSDTNEALKAYVDRISRLLDERESINEDISEIYKESKDAGFVTKHLRRIVAEFRMDGEARQSQYETLTQYRQMLGLLDGTPLGEAAMRRVAEQAGNRRRGRPRKQPANSDGDNVTPLH